MHYLEITLIGVIVFYPIVDLIIEKYKSKKKLKKKIFDYFKISFIMWLPTFLLVYLFSKGQLSVVNFVIVIEDSWQNILFASLLFVAIIYLLLLIRSIRSSEELRAEITNKLKPYKDILPVSTNEMFVFTLILSVSAGICEELLFRAYLFTLIDNHIGMVAAILLSSAVFGLWHIYLGWQEVIRTSVMGAAFCGVFIFTGNIILPILLHVFVDVYSGLMFYFAMRKPPSIIQKS